MLLTQFPHAGPLKEMAARAAAAPASEFVLLIDELNRGNVPKVFGYTTSHLCKHFPINERNLHPIEHCLMSIHT